MGTLLSSLRRVITASLSGGVPPRYYEIDATHPQSVCFVDSHTGGEPTRVVIAGGPPLTDDAATPVATRRALLSERWDRFRSAMVNEPRGGDAMVGALLVEPHDSAASLGVIFFNNVGTLWMCGHGLIGVVTTLHQLGVIAPGVHVIETAAGNVTATLHADGTVSFLNVPSYRLMAQVPLEVPGVRCVHGDVAWGGNWFFICHDHGLEIEHANLKQLSAFAQAIAVAIARAGLVATDAGTTYKIDHVELTVRVPNAGRDPAPSRRFRNFVLCPGGAYDRSPCGTGTSAHLACLAADGELRPGESFVQESVIGSEFIARFHASQGGDGGRVIPEITGKAHIMAKGWLVLDAEDPYRYGIGVR